MFYHLVMFLKPRVHLKYHVAAMGSPHPDCSYCLMLSENRVLKGSLHSHQNNSMLAEDSQGDGSVPQTKHLN